MSLGLNCTLSKGEFKRLGCISLHTSIGRGGDRQAVAADAKNTLQTDRGSATTDEDVLAIGGGHNVNPSNALRTYRG